MTEREIFLAALDLQDPTDRQRFLDQACGGDTALRAAVDALFASHQRAGEFLQTPLVQAPAADAPAASASDVHEQTVQLSKEQMAKNAAEDEADNNSQPLTFLSPSTKPGSLGRLAHYEVLEVLGRGAFGTVLKAFDEKLHRMVAIKVMSTELAATSPARKRFLREARSSAAIRHENVVAIHAVEEQPLPYLVMEYIPGQTLQQALDGQGPIELADILRLGQQIASGLAAAHSQGLIHRDIKPANILLEDGIQWKVKITDFGLARAADDASVTQSGMIAGTPMFMSPEQAQTNQIDQRSDLFSFGSVLYQMTSGRPPFRAPNTLAVLRRVTEETPHPIQEIIPETPDWLCTIISKLHEKRPEDRYQTAQEVADLLAHCQAELQMTGKVNCVTPNRSTTTPHPKPANQRTPESPSSQTPRSEAWGKVLGGLLALAVLIPTVWFALGQRAQRPAETSPVSTNPITRGEKSVPVAAGWYGWPADAPKPAIAPFDAEQAKQHQEEWAAYLKVPVEYTNSIGMKFRLIPPGEFTMGSGAEEIKQALREATVVDKHWLDCIQSEAPKHVVVLTRATYVGVTEVTQQEYFSITGVNPSYFSMTAAFKDSDKKFDTDNFPVEMVSWIDAAGFASKLSQKEGFSVVYDINKDVVTSAVGTGYRLLTEAEWEFACRAGTSTRFWKGDTEGDMELAGWYAKNSEKRTHSVAELPSNPFGLYDVHGNIWEWTADGVENAWEPSSYAPLAFAPAVDPTTSFESSARCVLRGGFWDNNASLSRSASRVAHAPVARTNFIGFRVSISVDAVRQALKFTGPAMPKSPVTEPDNHGPASENASSKPPTGWHGWPTDAPKPAIAPFNADEAKKHQEAWAKYLNVPVEYTNSIGMKFRLIPPGEFLMGSSQEEIEAALKNIDPNDRHWQECIKSEAPQHKVTLTQPIYLGVNEVTQAEYEKVMGVNPSHFAPMGAEKDAVTGMEATSRPVEMVSCNDAAEFCAKLSKREELKPFYLRVDETITPLDGTGYRLPTEAEWEYACRAGTTTKYWIGGKDEDLVSVGWFGTNSGARTHAAGELKANPFGLYAIHGNVWEWAQDGSGANYYGQFQDKPAINPYSLYLACHLRGGNWYDGASVCRAASRLAVLPTLRNTNIGFRVSLPVDAVRTSLKLGSSS
jgi:formylglycine-generating enzyme required for sulfatase activity